MAVKVQFQIGHSSKLRSKKTVEGFTHDWELYVKGVQQADISAFVEKIIFNLHESFQKPKRTCNKPPYVIQESGYAGFIVFIDIYFRNRDEPKKVQFNYDLDLQQNGPPQHRHEIKTFIFDNPSEEYRQKLLKGGGVPVSGVVAGSQPPLTNNIGTIPAVGNLIHSPGDGHKSILSEGKKHKLRPDDTRSNSFANLFGTPITKTSAIATTAVAKHSPDNKIIGAASHALHQSTTGASLPPVKEKSKDKDKSSEKSKDRPDKREKHHKQSLNSPHKEGRSESKKSDSSKHEKRDKTEEKAKKDKNRDKDRERERDKSSSVQSGNITNNSSNSKKPSPKPAREHSPHKSATAGTAPANTLIYNSNSVLRPSSSNSGKLEELKTSSKSSKDLSAENKSKESKQKEPSSSSSGRKSKKEKKDKDKERDKEKRHEEREKHKLAENQHRSSSKEDCSKVSNNINLHTNNTNSLENKLNITNKPATNSLNSNISNDVVKKPEKAAKQDLFKASSDKTVAGNTTLATPASATAPANNNSNHSSAEKKSSSNSSLNSNSNPPEKDKRSHKHKKKEKNKDKDKDRERDKDREKEKDKERDKDKEKEKEGKREKENKEKHAEEKTAETPPSNSHNTNITKALITPEEHSNSANTSTPSITNTTIAAPYTTTTAIPSSSSSSSSVKSSKSKDKKSKDKSATKEEKLKRKANDVESEGKTKRSKPGGSNSVHTSSSLSTSSSSSSVSTAISNAKSNPPNPIQAATSAAIAAGPANNAADTNLNLDLSDTDSLPTISLEQMGPSLSNNSATKVNQQPSPIIAHSESSNSSFPELQPPKQQPASKIASAQQDRSKSFTVPAAVAPPVTPLATPVSKEPPKPIKSAAKEKPIDKPPKDDEKEKKKRRNSQALNTFIEPPLKQLKNKETSSKSLREKSKSPSLRNAGTRASTSAEAASPFLQPTTSSSSTTAAAPLPPPSSAPSSSRSPALSAAEAVGNATSATANAATCNTNSTSSSTMNFAGMATPHQLNVEYLSELHELHHKIMTIQSNEELQHVVEMIAATGCYEITTKTFDFDLCKLDRGTVQRLQEYFATSVS